MKNIFVLPSEKPENGYVIGRCIKGLSDVKVGEFRRTFHLLYSEEYFQPHEIYITSDEKPKEGDYAYHKIFGAGKIVKIKGEDCFVSIKRGTNDGIVTTPWKRNIPGIKKIVLSTDLELIKDKVQAIEDTFLDWFIENPTCEFVDIEKVTVIDYNFPRNVFYNYRIIIPKQEPKGIVDRPVIIEEFGPCQELKGLLFGERYGQVGSAAELPMFKEAEYKETEKTYSESDMINFAWFLIEKLGRFKTIHDKIAHFQGEYLNEFENKK